MGQRIVSGMIVRGIPREAGNGVVRTGELDDDSVSYVAAATGVVLRDL
jgi:hypothetical protein